MPDFILNPIRRSHPAVDNLSEIKMFTSSIMPLPTMKLYDIDAKVSISAETLNASHGPQLAKLGFSLVIILDTNQLNTELFAPDKIKIRNLGVRKGSHVKVIAPMGIASRVINRATGRVLLCCSEDCERSTIAALFYLIRETKVSPEIALSTIRQAHPHLRPFAAFYEQICDFFDVSPIPQRKYNARYKLSQITPQIWITNFERSEDVPALVELGITRVINVTPQSKPVHIQAAYKSSNIMEHRYGIDDIPSANIISVIEDVLLKISPEDKLLIHCHAGISRSVSVAIGILINKRQMKYEDALQLVKDGREIASPNDGFATQLQTYCMHNNNM